MGFALISTDLTFRNDKRALSCTAINENHDSMAVRRRFGVMCSGSPTGVLSSIGWASPTKR